MNFNEYRPFKDYTDLAITVIFGVSAIFIAGLADEFYKNSLWKYFWYAIALLLPALIIYQTLNSTGENKTITLVVKAVFSYFFIFVFFIALIAIVFVFFGAFREGGAKLRKPAHDETIPEYISKRNQDKAYGKATVEVGAGVATGTVFLTIFLAKYLVKNPTFTSPLDWLSKN